MIHKISLICIAIIISTTIWAKNLSETAYFSILTCAPGTDIHAHFGHSAIRLCDTANNVDVVFNYGIFRFTDDFAYNFVKGETYYQLGVQQFSSFISEYYMDSRGVIEQQLHLTNVQKETLFTLLQTNYLPQNRKYLYNFFYDNCSSRPRDLLIQVLGDSLIWNKPTKTITDTLWMHTVENYLVADKNPTWRNLIHSYVGPESWLRFGISLGIGAPADKQATLMQSMFLPDCLYIMAEWAQIQQKETTIDLVEKTQILVPHEKPIRHISFFSYPATILWIICLFFICIAFVEFKFRTHIYLIDSLLFFIFGLIGIFVWYVSFISIHPAVFPNIHAVWASPILIVFALIWLVPAIRKYSLYYFHLHSALLIIYIACSVCIPQYYHSGYIALALIQLSRYPFYSIIQKK